MKINRSAQTEYAANEILDYLRGDDDTTSRRKDPIVSISDDGDLLFYNAACGTDDNETVLIDRLDADSMGDGWESKELTTDDVIEWLETYCTQ